MNTISFREFMIRVVHSKVSLTLGIYKSIISSPAIRIQNRFIEVNLSLYYRSQSICLTVWDDLCINLDPSILILSFDKPEDWLFQCSSSSLEFTCKSSFSFGSEVAFIYFYFSTYFFFESIHSIFIDNLSEYTKISIYSIRIYIQ